MLIWNFIIGCTAASFVNVTVIRGQKGQDYLFSRSCCPSCGHVLNWVDMLPILGYLIRRGKCHYCGCNISFRYLLVEITGGVLALMSRNIYEFILYMVLLAVGLYDADTMIIRKRYLIILMILSSILVNFNYVDNHLLGSVIISVPMRIIALTIKGFGFGDVKLMAIGGFLLGCERALLCFILGCAFGSLYALYLLVKRKTRFCSEMPFGPFLAAGIRLSWRYGFRIIDFYEFLFIRVYN